MLLMGKSTIYMVIFNSKLLVYQRVYIFSHTNLVNPMPWQPHKLQFRRVEHSPLFSRGYVGFLNVFSTFFQQTWLPADDRKRKAWLSWIARHTWWQTWKRLSQLVRVQWRVWTLPRKSSTYSHGAADREEFQQLSTEYPCGTRTTLQRFDYLTNYSTQNWQLHLHYSFRSVWG